MYRVLIVEDDPTVAQNLHQIFKQLGYQVLGVVSSGEAAVMHALKHYPDLITMGVKLEGEMTGLEAAARINASTELPIVFITREAEDDNFAKMLSTSTYGCILKPFTDRQIAVTASMAISLYQTRKALLADKEKLERVLKVSNEGFYDWNLTDDSFTVNERWADMLGYNPADINTVDFFKNHIHPDDLEYTLELLYNHVEGVSPKFINEYRMRCQDGSWLWVLSQGLAVERSYDKTALRIIGTHTNIHERKEVEDKLALLVQELEWSNWEIKSTNEQLHNEIAQRETAEQKLKQRGLELTRALKDLEESYRRLEKTQTEVIELEKSNSALAMAVTANHELNQPLMILQANMDMLSMSAAKVLDTKQHDILSRMQKAIEQMDNILKKFKSLKQVKFDDYSGDTEMVRLDK